MKKFSIIIPVFNNWFYTESCLKSIFSLAGYKPDDFEVVVADDDSEDGTSHKIKEFLHLYPGLRYLLNERNLGYAATCNRGAAQAGGEYLIFLNNDTRVCPGWDKSLVETMEKDRDIWIVGAKCIYPNGTIQHAGVAFREIFEQSLDHLYRDAPAFFPLADYEKDYQCVTGACIIIRREDFKSLNGFDEHYRNGFEDVDLCLRVHEAGKRIVYQPGCQIIHYESRSEGRQDAMADNMSFLVERWKNKVQPDEADHLKKDIEQSVKSGRLHLVSSFPGKSVYGSPGIFGVHELLKSGGLVFRPSKNPARIIVPAPAGGIGVHFLLAGEIQAESYGILQLNYLIKHEKFYSDRRCFTKKIYPGKNVLCFTVYSGYLYDDLILTLSGFSKDLALKALGLYSFSQDPSSDLPSLAVVCHISDNPAFVSQLAGILTQNEFDGIRMNVLFTADDPVYGDLPFIECRPGLDISYRNCRYAELPGLLNEFIEKSDSRYVLSINDGVAITRELTERCVELMETDPEIGVIHGETIGLIPSRDSFPFRKETFQKASLRNVKDIPLAFRTSSWRDAGGYDPRFGYYANMDLCLRILSSGNWKGYQIEGIQAVSFLSTAGFPAELKPGLEDFRELFFLRHSKFLLNQWKMVADERSMILKTYRRAQFNQSHQNPHSTLIGSVKIHFRHFLKKILNKGKA